MSELKNVEDVLHISVWETRVGDENCGQKLETGMGDRSWIRELMSVIAKCW